MNQRENQREKLRAFLYLLMRDHVTPGTVESVLADVEHDGEGRPRSRPFVFTNHHLDAYAEEIAGRLNG